MRKCYKCKIVKSKSDFGKDKSRKDGLRYICKQCANEYNKNFSKTAEQKEHKRKYAIKYRKTSETYKKYCDTPNYAYTQYKASSKTRKLLFDITFEDFLTFWRIPCYYCNDSIETIGLDRIDSSKGYIINNIVSCCTKCNYMKRDLNKEDFINHCNKIIGNNEMMLVLRG